MTPGVLRLQALRIVRSLARRSPVSGELFIMADAEVVDQVIERGWARPVPIAPLDVDPRAPDRGLRLKLTTLGWSVAASEEAAIAEHGGPCDCGSGLATDKPPHRRAGPRTCRACCTEVPF